MRFSVVLVTLALAACERAVGGGVPKVEPFATRDSAGIAIADNPKNPDAGVPVWFVDTLPSVVIGANGDPAAEFAAIGNLSMLNGGRIAVLDGRGETAFEFRIFDSTGRHLATHGRYGEGPGEFRWVSFFGPAGGDTIVAVDFSTKRLNWLTVSRGFARSIRLDEVLFRQLLGNDATGTSEMLVPLSDSVYAIKAFRSRRAGEPFARTLTYHIVDIRANRVLDVGSLEEPRGVMSTVGGQRTMVMPIEPGWPVHVVDRARKRICVAMTSKTEIVCADDQTKRTVIRWHIDPIGFAAEDRAATEEQLRFSLSQYRKYPNSDVDAYMSAVQWPVNWAPFSVLQIDPDGNFWILEKGFTAAGDRVPRFRILDPTGRHIAFANAFPARNVGHNTTTFIGSNAIVRVVEGVDGTPVVAVFKIHKQ
ncbi:MAG TPA: hypothetical protein VJR92_08725 [Gemmatimonadaceae bacterium]|nr:hypothetical protein [Gemmatimonadaceae bacterium]